MRLSAYFLPTLKENPNEAQIVSHRLMLRAGMIRQTSAGIYAWLPLGFRVLKKIEQIVREEQDAAGAQELLMPTIQPAELWKESGRYDDYGKEMLRIKDRHDREMLFGPTNEEMITDIFRSAVKSYRDLPRNLYHIQWKFRDEIRPRFGVMRGREFLMKDAYSFDIDGDSARRSYQKMFLAYLRTFARLGMKAIPMQADTGPIGGDLSHEFIILAETGESGVFCDKEWLDLNVLESAPGFDDDLGPFFEKYTSIYAATDEKHDPPTRRLRRKNWSMRAASKSATSSISAPNTPPRWVPWSPDRTASRSRSRWVPTASACRGWSVRSSRRAMTMPASSGRNSVAPFKVGLINLKTGDGECDRVCDELYRDLNAAGVEVLYDDRNERPGAKFADMDLIGVPWHLTIGPRGLKNGVVELKRRATGEREELSRDAAFAKLTS